MKRLIPLLSTAILAIGLFSDDASAQKLRLRAQITPECTLVSATANARFADIHADGGIAVQGSYGCRGMFIYDISNPDAPVLASWYNPGNNQQFLEAIVVGTRGYFGSGVGGGGVHVVDLTNPYQPVLLGTVDSTHGGGHDFIHEMMVWGNYLIENYNLAHPTKKIIKIVNVSDPANPVLKWELNPTDATWVHAMHIRGNRMYLSGWGGRIDIYDLTDLDTQPPALLGTIVGDGRNHSSWTSEDGNYLYSCRELLDGDLRVYNVSNPAEPLLVKSIKAGDLGLNAISPHNPAVVGNLLYVSWYQAGVQVFDITNPADPKHLGQYDTYETAFAPTQAEKEAFANLDPNEAVCGAENLQNRLPNTYDGNWAVFPFLGPTKVLAGDLKNGLLVLDASEIVLPLRNKVSDFDGDRKTDFSAFSPSTGLWSIESSDTSTLVQVPWGAGEDQPVNGDYDGDGKIDIAVFRPSEGMWYIFASQKGIQAFQFGFGTDIPVPGDYDADGRTDIAVFRPSNGVWFLYQSTLGFRAYQWGMDGDKPVPADYEGDGKTDIAVWRPSNGVWYALTSSSTSMVAWQWGQDGDKPAVGDYDGDGKSDFAVFRPQPGQGIWFIFRSSDFRMFAYGWGLPDDLPIPADYDGDGKTDLAVFRPSNNGWHRLNSSDGAYVGRIFGNPGDMPSPASAQPQ